MKAQNYCYVTCGTSLFRLIPSTCDTSFIGTTNVSLLDIAITSSGEIFGTDGYKLFKIDSSNAATVLIGSLGDTLIEYYNNLMAISDNYLIALNNNLELMKISVMDGSKSFIGKLDYYSSGDITFYKGNFYLAALGNVLIRFKLNNDFTEIISQDSIGVMDTGYDNVWGIITVGSIDCTNDNSKLYAFEYNALYEVNPLNADVILVCDTIYNDVALGAASLNEVFSPYVTELAKVPNVFTPNGDGINDMWQIDVRTPFPIELEIFDRWGIKVYSNNNSFDWDGKTLNGIECNEGVYFYCLRYENICHNINKKNGIIHLIR